MSSGSPGATRSCPHCRATILESADVCPSCRHHLRFAGPTAARDTRSRTEALRIEGVVQGPPRGSVEYTMVFTITNERGEEVAHQLVGVGALQHGDQRTFKVVVETVENR
ncbi:MAG: hypothetical protein U0974_15665 [Gemmatimonadales bacterium]|nr:hypothetical protein [Gemmatimonadales bacterium]